MVDVGDTSLVITGGTGPSSENYPMAIAWSSDGGQTWQRRSLSGADRGFARCIAHSSDVQSNVFCGGEVLGQGAVFRSTDHGRNWAATATAPAETVYSLAVKQGSGGSVVYAATPGGLYRSTDHGASWTNLHVSTGLRAVRVLENFVFTGGTNGVFRSDDAGENWEPFSQGLERTSVTWLEFAGSDSWYLLAGTTDGGAYRVALEGAGTITDRALTHHDSRISVPGLVRGQLVINGCVALGSALQVRIWALDGRLVYRAACEPADGRVHLGLSGLPAGVYWLAVSGQAGVESARLTVVR